MGYGKFMTVPEYCEETGLSKSNTYVKIRNGEIPVFRYSGKKLIPRSILGEISRLGCNDAKAINMRR